MSTHDDAAFVPDLGDLQDLLLSTETLREFLAKIAAQAAGDDRHKLSCGVTVYTSQRRPYTLSSSDEMASRLDEIQYKANGGPCLYALEQAVSVNLSDLSQASRWPDYQQQAELEGLVSSLSVPMSADNGSHLHQAVGALNLYTRNPEGFTDSEQQRAHAFAERVAGSVALAARLDEQKNLTGDLRSAMVSRSTIDQAVGVLMGQQRCTADDAFDLLRTHSQNRNVKVRDVAHEIITRVSGQEPQPGRPVT